jgi:predicted Zn-dependent peptidase
MNPDLPEPELAALPNGVRILTLALPQAQTGAVSVFIGRGSAHEPRALAGISHVVEHMVFKGTRTRDVHRINLDAELLGAELNAHTDKDHTAYHLRGLGEHAPRFVPMLADLVREPRFPAEDLAREREVLLQELAEDEDDALSTAYKLFDAACWGLHPVAHPVMGSRASLERMTRADLVAHVARHHAPHHLVVAAAGRIDADAVRAAAEAAFGDMAAPEGDAAGQDIDAAAPVYAGGAIRSRHLAGSSQAHIVLGGASAARGDDDHLGELAAAVLGEGMSSPLLAELRERRGLAYYAACAADVLQPCGQLVVEASVAPGSLDEALATIATLLAAQAARIAPQDLERARHQLAVRWLRDLERPTRRIEDAALDLLALGRVRTARERWQRMQAVTGEQVRARFAALLAAGVTVAVAGGVGRGVTPRLEKALRPLRA